MTSEIPLDAIEIGERDRDDLGDIASLARSIQEVGLLHPPVVTATHDLVAGGRRIAAVRSLGWERVPVTVVDLDSVADVLQAEADENTQRKGLTPYEASKARERRARVLAPKAAENKGGRPRKGETSANLAGVSSQRETRKVAATGTGYSGSTLDKVDRIRDIAERGVVKQGKTETPAPEPVVKVAREALEGVKQTGAAISRAEKDVDAAVAAYVDIDPDVQRARFRRRFHKATGSLAAVTEFDPADVAAHVSPDDWSDVEETNRIVTRWFDQVRSARRSGLRVIGDQR